MESILLIIGFGVAVGFCAEMLGRTKRAKSEIEIFGKKVSALESEQQALEERLDSIESKLMTEEERHAKCFNLLEDLTGDRVRSLAKGQELHFATKSWHYPLETPFFDQFHYRHECLVDSAETEYGIEVHGFSRHEADSEWAPYRFYAKADDCSTFDCAGTIRIGWLGR